MTWPTPDPPGRSACGAPASVKSAPSDLSSAVASSDGRRVSARAAAVASRVSGEVGSDTPVASLSRIGSAPVVGGEQRLDPVRGARRHRRTRAPGRRPAPPDRRGPTRPGTGISLARHRRPWFTSRMGSTLNAPSRGKVSHGFRIIFPEPRGARPGRTSSSGRPPPGRAPAPRPPPRPRARRTGGVERPVRRRRLPHRAG